MSLVFLKVHSRCTTNARFHKQFLGKNPEFPVAETIWEHRLSLSCIQRKDVNLRTSRTQVFCAKAAFLIACVEEFILRTQTNLENKEEVKTFELPQRSIGPALSKN